MGLNFIMSFLKMKSSFIQKCCNFMCFKFFVQVINLITNKNLKMQIVKVVIDVTVFYSRRLRKLKLILRPIILRIVLFGEILMIDF